MSRYIFEGQFQFRTNAIKVRLLLFYFEDENRVHFIYSPHLDLSGYGTDFESAKKSFEIVFEDFIDYTVRKKTLTRVLTKLGWQMGSGLKPRKRILAPSITSIIKDKGYVSDIFNRYSVTTYHQEVGIPVNA
ncbi:MAG: hypothetical protein WCP32_14460 [Bacteroidota bacterium]